MKKSGDTSAPSNTQKTADRSHAHGPDPAADTPLPVNQVIRPACSPVPDFLDHCQQVSDRLEIRPLHLKHYQEVGK